LPNFSRSPNLVSGQPISRRKQPTLPAPSCPLSERALSMFAFLQTFGANILTKICSNAASELLQTTITESVVRRILLRRPFTTLELLKVPVFVKKFFFDN
jgi:hypothetical protein